jgi:hypothetical protein
MSIVSGVARRRSVPIRSGAAITDQRLKCVLCSVRFHEPLPIWSMSGSFHRPGPAYRARVRLNLAMLDMLL